MTTSNDQISAVVKEDLVIGKGASAAAGDDIVVHYVGWLESGQQFDSTARAATRSASRSARAT